MLVLFFFFLEKMISFIFRTSSVWGCLVQKFKSNWIFLVFLRAHPVTVASYK